MGQKTSIDDTQPEITNHSFFANTYELLTRGIAERSTMERLRRKNIGQATGVVLEVGAGTGLNFPWYLPEQVERVEAIEPDTAMLRFASKRVEQAHVPIKITQAAVEHLPFPDETFDSVVATLVFCSVSNPERGFLEIKRVLKPGGTLILVEHVRSSSALTSKIQDSIVPLTKRMFGNCHWNRDTASTVSGKGFQITFRRDLGGFLLPMLVLKATRV